MKLYVAMDVDKNRCERMIGVFVSKQLALDALPLPAKFNELRKLSSEFFSVPVAGRDCAYIVEKEV